MLTNSLNDSETVKKRKRGRPKKSENKIEKIKIRKEKKYKFGETSRDYSLRSHNKSTQALLELNASPRTENIVSQIQTTSPVKNGRGRPRKSGNTTINNAKADLSFTEPSNPVNINENNEINESSISSNSQSSPQITSQNYIANPPPDFDLVKIMQYVKWYYRGESISNIIRLHRDFFHSRYELTELHFKCWIYQLETTGCINYHHLDDVAMPSETDLDNISDICDMKLIKTEGETDYSDYRYCEPEELNIKTDIVVEEAKIERGVKVLSPLEYNTLVKNVQYLKWYFCGQKITSCIRLHKELYRSPPFPEENAIRQCILCFSINGCVNPLHDNLQVKEDLSKVPAQLIINNLDLFEEYDLKNSEDKVLFRIIQCMKWYYRGESINEVLALHQIYFSDSSLDVNQIKLWILQFDINGCINPNHEQDVSGFDINNVPEQLFGLSGPF